jgi:membrane-associated phospholipid phosphatase
VIQTLLITAAFAVPAAILGALLWWVPGGLYDRLMSSRWMRRVSRARDALIGELGSRVTAVATLLLGFSGIVVILWPLGLLAHALEGPIDLPAFAWIQARFSPDDPLTGLLTEVTKLGNLYESAIFTGAAALFFAVVWRRRQWGLPPLLLLVTLAAEVELQRVLRLVVDRGHPPTALATWPSGGTARIIAVLGVVFFLALLTWPGIGRQWRIAGFVTVGVLGAIEGYTRYYLLQHWLTDIVGGWIFGELLLVVMIVSASIAVRPVTVAVTHAATDLDMRTAPGSMS